METGGKGVGRFKCEQNGRHTDKRNSRDLSLSEVPSASGWHQVTSAKGLGMYPFTGAKAFHDGIDLKTYFEPVYSVLDGTVDSKGYDANSELLIRICQEGGIFFL